MFSLPDLGLALLRELSGGKHSVDCTDFDRSSGDMENSGDGIEFGFEIGMGSLESAGHVGGESPESVEVGRDSLDSAGHVGGDSPESAEVDRDSPESAEIDMDSADQPLDSTVSDQNCLISEAGREVDMDCRGSESADLETGRDLADFLHRPLVSLTRDH